MSDFFGQGVQYPMSVSAGRLRRSSGEDRIFEAIELILQTPRGTCPLDPDFGVDLDAYDPVQSATNVAWRIAEAIERSEPRIGDLEVAIIGADEASVTVDVRFVPVGSNTRHNRVYPFYRRV